MCPFIFMTATSADNLPVPVNIGTATDLFAVTITNDAPAAFPVGVTTVTWTATDANGNIATATQPVLVSYVPPAGGGTEAVYWEHNDHLGTPQAMTDINGTVVWTASQTPFGIATVNEDPDGDGIKVRNNFRFPGQYFDAETGLFYNYQRMYDPAVGGYTQHDPIGLNGGMNPFGYVLSNPIGFIDPLGLLRYSPTAGDPVNETTTTAMECFETCAGHEVTITGGREGGHSPGSAHETGQACDVGTNSNPWLDRVAAEQCFTQCFDQNSSYGQQEGSHFHFQTHPGRRGSTGFPEGIR